MPSAIDLSIFAGFDSEVPEQTAQAMRDNQGMTGFAYTGTGDIVDLSSLEGLGADDDDPNDPSASRRSMFDLNPLPKFNTYIFGVL